MKPAKDWVTAYDVSGMNTASASELEAWVRAIQDDAQEKLKSQLLEAYIGLRPRIHPSVLKKSS